MKLICYLWGNKREIKEFKKKNGQGFRVKLSSRYITHGLLIVVHAVPGNKILFAIMSVCPVFIIGR